MISVLGATLGLGLAYGIVQVLKVWQPAEIPRLTELSIDGAVLAFTITIALATAILIGIVPALRAPYREIVGALREGERSVAGHRKQGRLRALLVGVEVAMSLVLLVGAGLLARSFREVLSVDRGFESENRLFFEVALPPEYDRERLRLFLMQFLERVDELPQVVSAGAVNVRPLRGESVGMGYAAADRPVPVGEAVPWASWRLVTPDYFQTMGVPIVAGRLFTDQDIAGDPWRVIVSERIASELWPGENAVGRSLNLWQGQGGAPAEIVGVARDMRDWGLEADFSRTVYIPFYGRMNSSPEFLVHTAGPPAAVLPAVRAILAEIDTDLPVSDVRTLDDMIGASVASRRFLMLLLGAFAGVALLLALAGVYGVLSYAVARRRAEIGMRIALGASRRGVVRLILAQGLRPVAAGLALGLVAAFALSRLMTSMLFEVAPVDAPTYVGVTALLALASVFSCWMPAYRATRVDVMSALREE